MKIETVFIRKKNMVQNSFDVHKRPIPFGRIFHFVLYQSESVSLQKKLNIIKSAISDLIVF